MKIKVAWQGSGKVVKTKALSVCDILDEMEINPETVIVSVNGEIVPESTKLKERDAVEILKVVSGG